MHLLVIEDERALCETIVRSLRRLAYSVDYCYDGEKALALLGVERYDLVLLDLNLPKKDGMTVLRTLRQTDRETRVLILSARSEVDDKVEGLDAGANDADPKGNGHFGISDGTSGTAGESGGADGARLGQQRGQLQQLHSRPHLRHAQKAPRRAGL